MAITQDAQGIGPNASPEDKIAYMQNLLDTLRDLDRNKDFTISTAELADERIRNYIKYRDTVDRTPSADPLKELREDLIAAIAGDATAHDNVVETLRAIQATDQKPLQAALATAATLTGKPAPRAPQTMEPSAGSERTRQEILDQTPKAFKDANPGFEQGLAHAMNTPPPPYDKHAKVTHDSTGAVTGVPTPDPEAGYKAMVEELKKSGAFTPEVDKALREGMGLPPKKAEAHAEASQQDQIAKLGAQLAQYNPQQVEASPGAQALSAAVNQASRNGHGGR